MLEGFFCIKKEILFIITLPTETFSVLLCSAFTFVTFPWHWNKSVTCSKAICEHLGGSVNKRPGKHTGVQRSSYYLPSQPFLGISLPCVLHQVPDDADKGEKEKNNKNKMGPVIAKLDDKSLHYLHLENIPVCTVNV